MNTVSKRVRIVLAALAAGALAGAPLSAATTSTLTTGLFAPVKIATSTKGNLLVAEARPGPNTGRVSIVDPATGVRRTLLDHLPSGLAVPDGSPSGPSGLAMRGRTLYVAIGLGDAVINGVPGTQVPNPHPSSPIFSSVLAVHFSANVEMTTTGFILSYADQVALKSGAKVSYDDGGGDKISIELIADFPDYVPQPVPANAANVRQSNPFGIVVVDDTVYVSDASSNTVRSANLTTGAMATVTTFAPLPNTRGFGPPVVEAVPDSIRLFNNQLLVTLLSGFPFPIGQAQARVVDIDTGTSAPFIVGLTSAIDVLPVSKGGFLTLEYSADMLAGLPGRLRSFTTPAASPVVITSALITPTSMARDANTGVIFVTEISTGRIIKVTP